MKLESGCSYGVFVSVRPEVAQFKSIFLCVLFMVLFANDKHTQTSKFNSTIWCWPAVRRTLMRI